MFLFFILKVEFNFKITSKKFHQKTTFSNYKNHQYFTLLFVCLLIEICKNACRKVYYNNDLLKQCLKNLKENI